MKPDPTLNTSLWRILDAAANRAAEGLRVAEDYVRFALDDGHLTREWKSLRHDLASAVARMDDFGQENSRRHASRSTLLDVGTTETIASEAARGSLSDVFAASVARSQQALRSLEEYGKLLDASLGAAFESLRYRSYTLATAVVTTGESCHRLAAAQLYVILDGQESPEQFESLAENIYAGGAEIIQLRDKNLDDRQLVERARILASVARRLGRIAIINDRADIAAAVNALGVHVGQEEMTVKDARRVLGPDALVGLSTHSIEQARRAVLEGANYIGVGPTFPSTTKSFESFPGLEFVSQVAEEIGLPAFAIGGITLERLPEVQAAGLQRVAVSGAITSASDPAEAAQRFKDALENSIATPTASSSRND